MRMISNSGIHEGFIGIPYTKNIIIPVVTVTWQSHNPSLNVKKSKLKNEEKWCQQKLLGGFNPFEKICSSN